MILKFSIRMKFLADESLEYPIVLFLKEKKIDIIAVRDFMKGAEDWEIIEYAFNNEMFIITLDKDFGELTFRLKKSTYGIIFLRLTEMDHLSKAKLLLTAIEKLTIEAKNHFIVIDKLKVRIRSAL